MTRDHSDSLALVKITDYGLGTFNGQPLVLWGRNAYHRHDHGGRVRGATFTEEFLIEGWHVPRCKVCFPHG